MGSGDTKSQSGCSMLSRWRTRYERDQWGYRPCHEAVHNWIPLITVMEHITAMGERVSFVFFLVGCRVSWCFISMMLPGRGPPPLKAHRFVLPPFKALPWTFRTRLAMQHGGPEPLRIPSSTNNPVGLVTNKHELYCGMLRVYHMTQDDGCRRKCAHVTVHMAMNNFRWRPNSWASKSKMSKGMLWATKLLDPGPSNPSFSQSAREPMELARKHHVGLFEKNGTVKCFNVSFAGDFVKGFSTTFSPVIPSI